MRNLMDQLKQALEPIQTQLNRLSSRERAIVSFIAVGMVFFIAVVILLWVGSSASSLQTKLTKSKKNLQTIETLGKQYQALDTTVTKLDDRIARVPRNFGLATELERIASRNALQIDSIKDRDGPPHEYYKETQVILSLKDVELRTLIDFLQAVENSNRFMRVSDLVIKPGFKDPTKLSVQTVISTFQSLETE